MCEYTRVSRVWKYPAVELQNIDYNGSVMLRHISVPRERFKITVLLRNFRLSTIQERIGNRLISLNYAILEFSRAKPIQ